jgi:hypothetical protein
VERCARHGGAEGAGVLRCAQDDGRNNGNDKDNGNSNGNGENNSNSKNKCNDNSTSRSPSGMTTK